MPDQATAPIPDSRQAESVELGRGDTAREATAAVARVIRDHLAANLPVAIDGRNAEGVHQVRVALRRFRALVGLLRRDHPGALLDEAVARARVLGRAVGDARDWDVFLLETLPGVSPLGLADINVAGVLLPQAHRLRQVAYDRVREVLEGEDAARVLHLADRIAGGGAWEEILAAGERAALEEPAADFAARHLARLRRKVLRRGRDFALLPPPGRHRVRLALKRLRYSAEFFAPLYGPAHGTARYLRRMARLQAVLGAESDVLTTRALLERFDAAESGDVGFAAGAVTGFLCCRQVAAHDSVHQRWRKFRHAAVFWDG